MSRVRLFHSRFFWKIYLTFSLMFLCITLAVGWIVADRVQSSMKDNVVSVLRDKIHLLTPEATTLLATGATLEASNSHFTAMADAIGTRITVIAAGGKVLADSQKPMEELDNHWHRPEVEEALVDDFGTSERYSESLELSMLYMARAIRGPGGEVMGVLRLALPVTGIQKDATEIRSTIGLIAIGGFFLALIVGWQIARRVAIPVHEMVEVAEHMRRGNYDHKVKTIHNDEVGRLADTLNRLGTELTHQISESQRLERVRRDFVANVSHEIKTPLTSIRGYVETLKDGAIHDTENNMRFLDKIERNAMRLSQLVQDLLSLARIESDESHFDRTPTDWTTVVNSVLASYEDAIQERGLRVSINQSIDPLVVMGDKEAMVQVLDNLVTNAIKYTPEGGHVYISLTKDKEFGYLIVKDTGIGIPKKHLARIFERFYRVDKARSRAVGGTGLGLSIVKHLVTKMNGTIEVESTVGEGSRFTVSLNLAT